MGRKFETNDNFKRRRRLIQITPSEAQRLGA